MTNAPCALVVRRLSRAVAAVSMTTDALMDSLSVSVVNRMATLA